MIQVGKKKESQRRNKILLYQWIHAHVWDLGEKNNLRKVKMILIEFNRLVLNCI